MLTEDMIAHDLGVVHSDFPQGVVVDGRTVAGFMIAESVENPQPDGSVKLDTIMKFRSPVSLAAGTNLSYKGVNYAVATRTQEDGAYIHWLRKA